MRGKKRREHEQDFELNLASVIDCFVVLIIYLLTAASFIALGVFDVGKTVNQANQEEKQQAVDVAIALAENRSIHLNVQGAEVTKLVIPARDQNWDFESLTGQLVVLKSKWPDLKYAVLSAYGSVEYTEIIRTIEVIRATVPAVALGDAETS